MANPEAVGILQQGVARWNEWRKDKDGPSLDLSGEDLSNRDLNGANLRCADLQDVNFSSADLFQADLRETNLQGANLSTAKGGLLSRQLAGADLTGAKLPEPLGKLYDSLSSVKEISDSAQKLFLALLAGCLYSWLTIAQTTDVELITNRATTPLPIIQAAIPIVGFYVVTPLILLCLYFYFHFYLQKLWEELGSLPAVFTDGRELHKRTDPWLLNDLVRSHFTKLKDGRPFLSYFQAWVSVVLAWWLVPVTLFCFWLRYIRRHDVFWTMVHAALLALAVFSAVRLYRIANETLRGKERTIFRWKDLLKRRSNYGRLGFVSALMVFLILISLGTIAGEEDRENHVPQFQASSPLTWMPSLLNHAGFQPFANLRNADVSIKPPNWTGKKDEELDLVKGAGLRRSNLRNVDAEGAFFAKADLISGLMQGADLGDADLRYAVLETAHLEQADLSGALLQNADMRYTYLQGAFLQDAHLDHATMYRAHLEDAELTFTELGGAQLGGADLRRTSLFRAILQGADLTVANLEGADFEGANLQSAILRGANLTKAGLKGANLKYADCRLNADRRSFPVQATRGLTREMILAAENWQLAFYDPDMLKQLGLPTDHNEKLQKQMEEERAKAAATPPTAPALSIGPKAKP